MPHWAYNFCRWCQMRLASPGEMLCDRCQYDVEQEINRMTGEQVMPTTRCSAPHQCGAPVTHHARRHHVTMNLCASHYVAVAESLIRDGWIVSEVKAKVDA